jgi:hypothetical protein
MFVKYRLDHTELNDTYRQIQLETENEKKLEAERKKSKYIKTAKSQNVSDPDMPQLFRAPIHKEVFDTSFLSPYNKERGVFINIEALRGVGKELFVYKIVCSFGGVAHWTKAHDFKSDVGVPRWTDGSWVIPGVDHDPLTCTLFNIYRFKNPSGSKPGEITLVAWGVAKLFLSPDAVRHGRFTIPLFEGKPPVEFLEELEELPIEGAMMDWMNEGRLKYWKNAVLTYSQGDPLRQDEFTQQYESRSPAKTILIPESKKHQFPVSGEKAGEVLLEAKRLHGDEDPAAFNEALNRQFLKLLPSLKEWESTDGGSRRSGN